MELRQKGTVDEYLKEFEVIRYAAAIHNPQLDETMFVAHFIKGLKQELQGRVQSHVPATVDRAAFLARIQQNVLEKQRQKYLKFGGQGKINNSLLFGKKIRQFWRVKICPRRNWSESTEDRTGCVLLAGTNSSRGIKTNVLRRYKCS